MYSTATIKSTGISILILLVDLRRVQKVIRVNVHYSGTIYSQVSDIRTYVLSFSLSVTRNNTSKTSFLKSEAFCYRARYQWNNFQQDAIGRKMLNHSNEPASLCSLTRLQYLLVVQNEYLIRCRELPRFLRVHVAILVGDDGERNSKGDNTSALS